MKCSVVDDESFFTGANLALYDFILEQDNDTRIETFNKLLNLVTIYAKLSKHNGVYAWSFISQKEVEWAEDFFTDLIKLVGMEEIKSCFETDNIRYIIFELDDFLRKSQRRIETLRMIDEFECQV